MMMTHQERMRDLIYIIILLFKDFILINIFKLKMPFTDDQIRQAVMKLFKKYDKNQSGYIDG